MEGSNQSSPLSLVLTKVDKLKEPKEASTKKDNKAQPSDKELNTQGKPLNNHLKSRGKLHSKAMEHFKGKELFQVKAEFKEQPIFKVKGSKPKDKDYNTVKEFKDKEFKGTEFKDKEFRGKAYNRVKVYNKVNKDKLKV